MGRNSGGRLERTDRRGYRGHSRRRDDLCRTTRAAGTVWRCRRRQPLRRSARRRAGRRSANAASCEPIAMKNAAPDIQAVRRYWQRNPVAANAIPHALGTPEYFAYYDALREANEPPAFSARLHEYAAFAGRRVLDIGSGNGYVLSRYALSGARVCGVDLTDTAIGLCRQRFALMK